MEIWRKMAPRDRTGTTHRRFGYAPGMPMHPGIQDALRCIAERRWFEAHEGLEDAWRAAQGSERQTLQGMIHIVVAFEHVRRGNPRGARAQWQKANAKLGDAPDSFHGVQLAAWQRATAEFFADWADEIPEDLPARADHAPVPAFSTGANR